MNGGNYMGRKAVNWNELSSEDLASIFWNQNVQQFWLPEEFQPSADKGIWDLLSPQEREVYKKVLVGLTHLDTEQGGVGMPLISLHAPSLHDKAVFMFMGAMEEVHARSYAVIFTSLLSKKEEEELFKWQENHPLLQRKAEIIVNNYFKIFKPKVSKTDLYMAMVTSVFLESFLFYSGFYYPLYLAGQGKMVNSAEIINLIIRDESIHGVFVGIKAQELYNTMTQEEKDYVDKEVYILLNQLYEIEEAYTKEIYEPIGLVDDVINFVKYNANKALQNLGRESYFEHEDPNPIVMNGLRTDTKNHDFFSVKGNGYIKSVNVKPLSDDDFGEIMQLLSKTDSVVELFNNKENLKALGIIN
jgi:ribonucleoside-diphosphate reductase beta chain